MNNDLAVQLERCRDLLTTTRLDYPADLYRLLSELLETVTVLVEVVVAEEAR